MLNYIDLLLDKIIEDAEDKDSEIIKKRLVILKSDLSFQQLLLQANSDIEYVAMQIFNIITKDKEVEGMQQRNISGSGGKKVKDLPHFFAPTKREIDRAESGRQIVSQMRKNSQFLEEFKKKSS